MDLVSTHICMTKDLGIHGNLFGGIMVAWIDEAAASYACMYCDTPHMVTVKINELVFKRPVKRGDMVRIYCKIKNIGNTSATLYVEVKRHTPEDASEVVVTSTTITFVRINEEDGHSKEIDQKIKDKFLITNTLEHK